MRQGCWKGAWKIWLKIHYIIEPAQLPPFEPDQRVKSLRILIALLDNEDILFDSEPVEIRDSIPRLRYHLRGKLLRDTQKCFGADLAVAKFEHKRYEQDFGVLEEKARTDLMTFGDVEYIPVAESGEQGRRFVRDVNALLRWAGCETRREEDIV
jgi:hypothetical protein